MQNIQLIMFQKKMQFTFECPPGKNTSFSTWKNGGGGGEKKGEKEVFLEQTG